MNNLLKDMIAAGTASAVTYPIDVIKTQFQVTMLKNQNVNFNVNKLIHNLYKETGFKGFYRGVTPSLLTYPTFWTVYFPLNNTEWKPTSYKYANKFILAYGSGAIAAIISNPLFILKTRLQTEILKSNNNSGKYNNKNNNNNNSLFNLTKNIYKNEGTIGFLKGLRPTFINNIKLGFQFPFYDFLKEKTNNVFISAMISKLTVSSIAYPLDLVRTNQRNSPTKLPLLKIFKDVHRVHGIKGLYRGVGLYNLVTGPNFILMMVLRDLFMKYL